MSVLVMIIIFIIALGIIYGVILVDLIAILDIFSIKKNWKWYLLPLCYTIFFLGVQLICKQISALINKAFYLTTWIILGIVLNCFLTSWLYLIIGIFYKWSKISGIIIVIIIPGILTIYGLLVPFFITIDRITLKNKNFKGGKTTICQISDVHLGAIYQRDFTQKIVNKVNELNPDIVVITGDLSDGSYPVQPKWLEPFNQIKQPILYITGNHEQIHGKEKMLKAISTTKIIHLKNIYEFNGINFIGIDYEDDLRTKLNILSDRNPDNINVCLVHVPSMKAEELKNYDIFLMLAGHTHGGQIFPLHIPTLFSNACFWGLYENQGRFVYVSTGVGTANVPMRTFCKSQISLITIENDNSDDNCLNCSQMERNGDFKKKDVVE